MFDNNRQGSNAPILTGASLTEAVTLTHTAYNFVWGRGATLGTPFTYEGVYHLLISNTGPQNVWVGNKTGVKGVLLQPGASLNLSVGREGQVWVRLDIGADQDLNAILFC
tara:strand:+ start:845 stop:1174 length:330 start_codon:yes stop_codon:yes gene_type:complete